MKWNCQLCSIRIKWRTPTMTTTTKCDSNSNSSCLFVGGWWHTVHSFLERKKEIKKEIKADTPQPQHQKRVVCERALISLPNCTRDLWNLLKATAAAAVPYTYLSSGSTVESLHMTLPAMPYINLITVPHWCVLQNYSATGQEDFHSGRKRNHHISDLWHF